MQFLYAVSIWIYISTILITINGDSYPNLLQWDRWYWRPMCPAAGIDKVPNDCPSSKHYRTIDGSCNNDFKINWGKARTPLGRMRPANYSDDRALPRLSHSGSPLPNPRTISLTMTAEDEARFHEPDKDLASFVMDFGQFLIHDISHSPLEDDMCGNCSTIDTCLPIPVADDDPSFSNCIRLRRSQHVPSKDCQETPWQQFNTITSFLDMSVVYGNNDFRANELRDRSEGKGLLKYELKPSSLSTQTYLPNDPYISNCVSDGHVNCGLSGDNRTSEQPGLTGLHTLFLRYHNNIATSLSQINQHWSDDRLYQETRRILGAIIQRITYSEYLPAILAQSTRTFYDLDLEDDGRSDVYYNPFVDPSVLNEFSAAAFRFGHSQVPSHITRVNRYYEPYQPLLLRFAFHNASIVYDEDKGGIDGIMLGHIVTPLSKTDESLTEEITEHLVPRPIDGPGRDLFAINIQRGRDHGLASYNVIRESCGLKRACDFDDLLDLIQPSIVEKLKKIYEHVDDIDLFVGGLSETPVSGGSIGHTFSCIIGEQFQRLKIGDYYWHERGDILHSFTYGQLQGVRNVTMARLFCDTLEDVWRIQPDVFRLPTNLNSRVTCEELPNLDLNEWKEAPST